MRVCYTNGMNKTIVGIVGVVVIALLVFLGINTQQPASPSVPEGSNPAPVVSGNPAAAPSEQVQAATTSAPKIPEVPVPTIVTYTNSGFTPATVTVSMGDMVTFKNDSSRNFWPATDPHPQHTGYPEKGGCRGSTFDACKPLAPGSSWSFIFKQSGTWEYHDHLSASHEGTVIVK